MTIRKLAIVLLLLAGTLAPLVAGATYSYSYLPKQVYATQLFPVTVLAKNPQTKNQPQFKFGNDGSLEPKNRKPLTVTNGTDIFYTFYFKAGENDLKIPSLTIVDNIQTALLSDHYIPVMLLDGTKEKGFWGLIAAECRIKSSRVTIFDSNSSLVSLVIEASEANPEEMHTPGATESGVEKIKRNGASVTIEYYFVTPASQKSTLFTYYNTIQRKFISKRINTNYNSNPVATHSELNPKDSSFDTLKKYALVVIGLLFLGMFLIRRDRFYLILLALVIIMLLSLTTQHKSICIQEGAPLYILPTHSSTSGWRIDSKLTTAALYRRGEYSKIEYKNGIIGWIKDEDLCND